jgi:signal transduction histidine kinase
MSVYQGVQNAQTNQKLRLSLAEVQTLSAQNLLKEQEKQQILSNQNVLLEQQVTERTLELNQSLIDLKSTQNQLIQREKMASLGELTAGIAHEIQNPLNFVNNFSEVSAELVDEAGEELKAGDVEETGLILTDIKQNLEKIRHHGKRADFIVKGMLEHSRTSKGEKTMTDINLLADEFLKLSYHGLRAKDKNFNAVPIAIGMITHFDENLPKIEVAQQDIGRVLLNLFNNAFYAVNQKARTAGADYKPTVEVTTFAPPSGGWGVTVKDNGSGIPEAIKDKIMQPFFTTKPTGEGTGLGLSLSYDIIVKGHGGTINIETIEGAGSEFTVSLPV